MNYTRDELVTALKSYNFGSAVHIGTIDSPVEGGMMAGTYRIDGDLLTQLISEIQSDIKELSELYQQFTYKLNVYLIDTKLGFVRYGKTVGELKEYKEQ